MLKKVNLFFLFLLSFEQTEFLKFCLNDKQCSEFYNNAYICHDNKCQHEGMLPLSYKKFIALILIIIVSILANASGIGGGAIFIPIYTLMFDFTIGGAIPLSKATILAGAITNIILSYDDRKQGNHNELIINYKLVSFIVPLILAGTMVGVIVMKIMPPLIIFVCLVFYLFISIQKVIKKGIQLHKMENQENLIELKSKQELEESPKKTFQELFQPNKLNMLMCVVSYILILLCALLRGGKGMDSIIGLQNCSFIGWVIFFITIAILFFGSLRIYIQQKQIEQDTHNVINSHLFQRLLPNVFISGILAGTLGIGGGLVINPVLLKEGLSPQVAAGVSSLVVLFSSMSTTTQYIIVGAFDIHFAIYIIIASGLGAIIGNLVLKKILRNYNKPSLMVWILASLLITSGIVLPIIGGIRVSQQKSIFTIGSPCQIYLIISQFNQPFLLQIFPLQIIPQLFSFFPHLFFEPLSLQWILFDYLVDCEVLKYFQQQSQRKDINNYHWFSNSFVFKNLHSQLLVIYSQQSTKHQVYWNQDQFTWCRLSLNIRELF